MLHVHFSVYYIIWLQFLTAAQDCGLPRAQLECAGPVCFCAANAMKDWTPVSKPRLQLIAVVLADVPRDLPAAVERGASGVVAVSLIW